MSRVVEVVHRTKVDDQDHFKLLFKTEDGEEHTIFHRVPKDYELFFFGEFLGDEFHDALVRARLIYNDLTGPNKKGG